MTLHQINLLPMFVTEIIFYVIAKQVRFAYRDELVQQLEFVYEQANS